MFDWLIDPIIKGISSILDKILRTLFYNLIWSIFIQGPLQIINIFDDIFTFLSKNLVNMLIFNNQEDFSLSNITVFFWIFVSVGLLLFCIFFTIQIIIVYFNDHLEIRQKTLTCLSNSLKSLFFIFFIPIAFFLANFLISKIINALLREFDNNGSLANILYYVGSPHFSKYVDSQAPPRFDPPTDLTEYNMMVELIAVYFVLYVLFFSELSLFQQGAELFFLFLVSPIIMSTMILDNGKKAFTWKDMALSRMLASSIILLGFHLLMFYLITLSSVVDKFGGSDSTRMSLIQLGLIIGGVMAFKEFPELSNRFLETSGFIDSGKKFVNQAKGLFGTVYKVNKGIVWNTPRDSFKFGRNVKNRINNINSKTPVAKSSGKDSESNSKNIISAAKSGFEDRISNNNKIAPVAKSGGKDSESNNNKIAPVAKSGGKDSESNSEE